MQIDHRPWQHNEHILRSYVPALAWFSSRLVSNCMSRAGLPIAVSGSAPWISTLRFWTLFQSWGRGIVGGQIGGGRNSNTLQVDSDLPWICKAKQLQLQRHRGCAHLSWRFGLAGNHSEQLKTKALVKSLETLDQELLIRTFLMHRFFRGTEWSLFSLQESGSRWRLWCSDRFAHSGSCGCTGGLLFVSGFVWGLRI